MKIATDLDVRGALTVAGLPIAAGSVILNGTGAPADALGAVGNYYLDETNDTLYGPKAQGSGPQQSAFTTQTPGGDGGAVQDRCMGSDIQFAVTGRIVGLRYYRIAEATRQRNLRVWTTGGVELGNVSTTADTGTGWKAHMLAAPITVTAGQTVRAVVEVPAGTADRIDVTSSLMDITNGDVHHLGVTNLAYTAGTFPTVAYGFTYYVDVIFEAGAVAWPVALKSVPPGGTTGQVLAKVDADDYDVTWAAAGSGGGSTILSGTATPTGAVGAIGDYYLDTDDRLLYGPKQVPVGYGSDQYIETPSNGTDAGNYMIGLRFKFLVAGRVTGIRLKASGGAGYEVYLFSRGEVMLASKDVPTLPAATWTTVLFDAPVTVAANTTYVAAVWTPSGTTIGRQTGAFAGLTVGDVRLLADNEDGYSGSYSATRDAFPNFATSIPQYQLTPVFQASGAGGDPWPVALKSVPAGGTTSQALVKTSATDYAAGWATPAAAGSVILNGTGAPADALGAVGNYYLDETNDVLYGPKGTGSGGFGLPQSAYTTQTPETDTWGPDQKMVAGNDFTFAKAGRLTGMKFWRGPAAVGTSRFLRAWSPTGPTLLATATTTGESGSGWITAMFPSPVTITAGQTLRCVLDDPNVSYFRGITPLAIVNGDISMSLQEFRALGSSVTGTYPGPGGGITYFVDVIYEPAAAAPIWPVALKSVPPGGTTGQVLGKTSGSDYDAAWAAGGGSGGASDSDQNILANQIFS